MPYYVTGDLWISFDDVDSIKEKVQPNFKHESQEVKAVNEYNYAYFVI